MGCCFSSKKLPKSKNIRIVGLNGLVQEIGYPITVGEVTGKPGMHFLITQPQLLTAAAATPLKVDAPLEAGRVYFLLPTTLFQSAPEELAPIARKLASIARKPPSKSKSKSCSSSSPSPFNDGDDEVLNKCGKSRSWKPVLSTIRERSFNRSSESDLQAQHSNIHDSME